MRKQDDIQWLHLEELRREIGVGTEQLESDRGTVYASGKEFADKIKAEGRKRLEVLLQEGLDSGDLIELTPEYVQQMRTELLARIEHNRRQDH